MGGRQVTLLASEAWPALIASGVHASPALLTRHIVGSGGARVRAVERVQPRKRVRHGHLVHATRLLHPAIAAAAAVGEQHKRACARGPGANQIKSRRTCRSDATTPAAAAAPIGGAS